MTNFNAYVRLSISGLLAVGGIILLFYSGVKQDNSAFAVGSSMLAGSGLTAWDTHVS